MKKGIIFFALIALLCSCNNDDDNDTPDTELVGNWKLTEILSDPGDGSGTFIAVVSEKEMEFYTDGSVISNGALCNISTQSDTPSEGTYSITDGTISSPLCNTSQFNIYFEIDGSNLIINYPCIEACRAKFLKIE